MLERRYPSSRPASLISVGQGSRASGEKWLTRISTFTLMPCNKRGEHSIGIDLNRTSIYDSGVTRAEQTTLILLMPSPAYFPPTPVGALTPDTNVPGGHLAFKAPMSGLVTS